MSKKRKQKQFVIVIGGASANGKSTLARNLKNEFNPVAGRIVILDSDRIRKELWYKKEKTKHYDLKAVLPPEAYSSEFNLKTYEEMFYQYEAALHEGWNVILDATFLDEKHRHEARKLAKEYRANFNPLWLENDQETLENRAETREKGVSDANGFVVGLQFKKDFGDLTGWQKIRTNKTAEDTLQVALRHLKI